MNAELGWQLWLFVLMYCFIPGNAKNSLQKQAQLEEVLNLDKHRWQMTDDNR